MDSMKVKPRAGAGPDESSEAIATLVSELRAPVQTVALWAKLLQLGALTPEQSVRAIDTILRSAMAQAHMLDDLLERTRLFRGEVLPVRGFAVMRPPLRRAEGVVDGKRPTSSSRCITASAISRARSTGRSPASASRTAMRMKSPQGLVHAALAPLLELGEALIKDADVLAELGLYPLDLVLVAIELEEIEPENGPFPLAALAHARTVGDLVELVEGWSQRDTIPSSVAGAGPRRRVG
jgi:hypothetical protein